MHAKCAKAFKHQRANSNIDFSGRRKTFELKKKNILYARRDVLRCLVYSAGRITIIYCLKISNNNQHSIVRRVRMRACKQIQWIKYIRVYTVQCSTVHYLPWNVCVPVCVCEFPRNLNGTQTSFSIAHTHFSFQWTNKDSDFRCRNRHRAIKSFKRLPMAHSLEMKFIHNILTTLNAPSALICGKLRVVHISKINGDHRFLIHISHTKHRQIFTFRPNCVHCSRFMDCWHW